MTEPREYLIRKNGYFYRPNRSGYTMEKVAAGRYTKAEAEREAAIEPENFTVLHESDIPDAEEVVGLKAENERLKDALSAIGAVDSSHPGDGDYSRGWMHGRWSLKKMALRAIGEMKE